MTVIFLLTELVFQTLRSDWLTASLWNEVDSTLSFLWRGKYCVTAVWFVV